MQHTMQLNPESFQKIREGTKTIESRINDEKRKGIKTGDTIEFVNRENPMEKIMVEVKDLCTRKSFGELFSDFPAEDFGSTSKEDLLESIHNLYNNQEEQELGVIGIRVKVI